MGEVAEFLRQNDPLEKVAASIAEFEGFNLPDSVARRNNNPGNLKDPRTGEFRAFANADEGWEALRSQIRKNAERGVTLKEFFGGKAGVYRGYAPRTDSNDPEQYAQFVAERVGSSPDEPVADVLAAKPPGEVAQFLAQYQEAPPKPEGVMLKPLPPERRPGPFVTQEQAIAHPLQWLENIFGNVSSATPPLLGGREKGSPELAALAKDQPLPLRQRPLVSLTAVTPEEGPAREVAGFFENLTSPEMLTIGAALRGLPALGAAGEGAARAVSTGFGIGMLRAALTADPAWSAAKEQGDWTTMAGIATRKALEVGFGLAAMEHAAAPRPQEAGKVETKPGKPETKPGETETETPPEAPKPTEPETLTPVAAEVSAPPVEGPPAPAEALRAKRKTAVAKRKAKITKAQPPEEAPKPPEAPPEPVPEPEIRALEAPQAPAAAEAAPKPPEAAKIEPAPPVAQPEAVSEAGAGAKEAPETPPMSAYQRKHEIAKAREDIGQGEMRLRSKVDSLGKKLSAGQLGAVRRSVENSKRKLAELTGEEPPPPAARAKEPWEMTSEQFRRKYAVHFDISGERRFKTRPEERVASMMAEGLRGEHAMASEDWDRSPAYNYAYSNKTAKAGAHAYVFSANDYQGPSSPYLKKGAKPLAHVVLESREPVHQALIRQALREGRAVPPEVLAEYPEVKLEQKRAARIAAGPTEAERQKFEQVAGMTLEEARERHESVAMGEGLRERERQAKLKAATPTAKLQAKTAAAKAKREQAAKVEPKREKVFAAPMSAAVKAQPTEGYPIGLEGIDFAVRMTPEGHVFSEGADKMGRPITRRLEDGNWITQTNGRPVAAEMARQLEAEYQRLQPAKKPFGSERGSFSAKPKSIVEGRQRPRLKKEDTWLTGLREAPKRPIDRMAQEGAAGEELAQRFDMARDLGEREAAKRLTRIEEAGFAKLTPAEAWQIHDQMQGIAPATSDRAQSVAAAASRGFAETMSEFQAQGGVVWLASGKVREALKRKFYFPQHTPTPKQLSEPGPVRRDVIENLVNHKRLAQTPEEAARMIDDFVDYVDTGGPKESTIQIMLRTKQASNRLEAIQKLNRARDRFVTRDPSLEFAREVDLPFYDPNPMRVLPDSLLHQSMGVKRMEMFGQGNEKVDELVAAIADAGGDANYVKHAAGRILGTINEPDQKVARVARALRALGTLKMTTTALLNVTQGPALTWTAGDFRAMVAGARHFTKAGRKFGKESGAAMESIVHEVMRAHGGESRAIGTYLKAIQMNRTEVWNRLGSAIGGADFVARMHARLRLNPKDTLARDTLKRYGLDPDAAIKKPKLDYDELLLAGKKFADRTQGRVGVQDVPLWASTEWGRLFVQFKPYSYNLGRLLAQETVGEFRKGRFGRGLSALLVAGTILPLTQVAYKEIRDVITGRKDKATTLEKWFEGVIGAAMLGPASDAFQAARYRRLAEWAVGPEPSSILRGAEAAAAGWDSFKRFAYREIPVLGNTTYYRVFGKRKQTKSPALRKLERELEALR